MEAEEKKNKISSSGSAVYGSKEGKKGEVEAVEERNHHFQLLWSDY